MIEAAPTVTPISAAICGSSESAARTIAWLEKPATASSAMARVGSGDAGLVGTDGRFVDRAEHEGSCPAPARKRETIMPQTADRLAAYRAKFSLAGKTALVLGAASGIGRASAEAMAALGAQVICADQNREQVEAVAADLKGQGAGGEAHVVDAGKSEDIRALAAAVMAKHKRLDIAVTTPAIHVRKLMLDYTDEEYDRVVDLNLRGTFYFLRAFGR